MIEGIKDDEDREEKDEKNWTSDFRNEISSRTCGREAAVVVLGDIGRSPRMCNHAKMLADAGFHVKIFGFHDSTPEEAIRSHDRIELIGIPVPPEMSGIPAAVQLPVKLVWNFFTLFYALLAFTRQDKLDVILMQNPPGLPTMFVCWLISRLKCATFTIDWHNYMYSILRDKYNLEDASVFGDGRKTIKERIVRSVAFLEGLCGRLSDANLCVTEAMRLDLMERWGVKANRFYDRPPSWKFGISDASKYDKIHDVFTRLSKSEEVLRGEKENDTILTHRVGSSVNLHPDRPLVLLSSTSWTADEKFEILLDALVIYDEAAKIKPDLPRVLMIITGKGPLKSMYLEEMRQKNLKSVDIVTPWLEAEDYPTVLASADLGISLHTSTSGLDLPMKVVDMFGVKVPVLAKKFNCIRELVEPDVNGYLFEDSEELASQIINLAHGFPSTSCDLHRLKNNILDKKFIRWESMWWRRAAEGGRLVPSERANVFWKNKLTLLMVALFIFLFFPCFWL